MFAIARTSLLTAWYLYLASTFHVAFTACYKLRCGLAHEVYMHTTPIGAVFWSIFECSWNKQENIYAVRKSVFFHFCVLCKFLKSASESYAFFHNGIFQCREYVPRGASIFWEGASHLFPTLMIQEFCYLAQFRINISSSANTFSGCWTSANEIC